MRETVDRIYRTMYLVALAGLFVGFPLLLYATRSGDTHGWQMWTAASALGIGMGSLLAMASAPLFLRGMFILGGMILLRRELRRRDHAGDD